MRQNSPTRWQAVNSIYWPTSHKRAVNPMTIIDTYGIIEAYKTPRTVCTSRGDNQARVSSSVVVLYHMLLLARLKRTGKMYSTCSTCQALITGRVVRDGTRLFCSVRCWKQHAAPIPIPLPADRRTRAAVAAHKPLAQRKPGNGYADELRAEKRAIRQCVRAIQLLNSKNEGTHTQGKWIALCRRYRWRCVCCGRRGPLTKDHIIPISKGGSDHITNIQPLCQPCNSSKGTQATDYR